MFDIGNLQKSLLDGETEGERKQKREKRCIKNIMKATG
jgi:hypothetical protein